MKTWNSSQGNMGLKGVNSDGHFFGAFLYIVIRMYRLEVRRKISTSHHFLGSLDRYDLSAGANLVSSG